MSTKKLAAETIQFGYVDPTYTIRLANPHADLETELATVLGNGQGCSKVYGRGLWEGTWEDDVAITIQCSESVLVAVFASLSRWYPNEDYLHVERHEVRTAYVDMGGLR